LDQIFVATVMIFLALLIGMLTGLRAFTPIAAVSWAARLGWLHLQGTWLAFLGHPVTPYILTILAIGELINDKAPKTPKRTVPFAFLARIALGALCGVAVAGSFLGGICAGALGAVIGTLGGLEGRVRLARAFGKDLPAALIEDVVAVGGALLIVSRFA
jgi:uncharacterized membrane protein